MKRILLDTNAYGSYLKCDEHVLDCLAAADTVFMSVFVLGELHAGFRGGSRFQRNIRLLHSFLTKPTVAVLDGSNETAEVYGRLKDELKRAGTPLPINDVWIAAHALETGSVLVTCDAHFEVVPGLRLWDW